MLCMRRCCYCIYEVREVEDDAAWRAERLGDFDLMQRIMAQGFSLSPLFAAPFFHGKDYPH